MLKLITRRVQMAASPQVKSMSSCELTDQVAAAAEGLMRGYAWILVSCFKGIEIGTIKHFVDIF